MGIFTRPLASGKLTYWITFQFQGRSVQERSGTDKRAAERLEKKRKREVAARTYSPDAKSNTITLAAFTDIGLGLPQ